MRVGDIMFIVNKTVIVSLGSFAHVENAMVLTVLTLVALSKMDTFKLESSL